MGVVIHLDSQGGGSGTGYIGVFANYTALTTAYPTAPLLSLAYVQNSQGTAWLPGSLGGTFYSKGTYLFDGVNWVDGLDEISDELQDLIDGQYKIKSGEVLAVSFAGNPKRASVVFSTPFSDNNYSIALTTNSLANSAYNPKVDSATKTANGFTISISANIITNLTSCMWIATKHGEN